jgi:transcriptional regulator with XRE-family HTH domain
MGRAAVARIGQELREARLDRSLSIDAVAATLGISNAEVSRIERGLAPKVPLVTLCRFAAVVGLDLVPRLYPGATPLRDRAHVELLSMFRSSLHRSLRWAVEVPLPISGDQRAWDATISGSSWIYGIEAETLPRDAQALVRRLKLKQRDGGVDGVVLVLFNTRRALEFLRQAADELAPAFPVPGARASELLRAGVNPGGNAIVRMHRRRGTTPSTSVSIPSDGDVRPFIRRA